MKLPNLICEIFRTNCHILSWTRHMNLTFFQIVFSIVSLPLPFQDRRMKSSILFGNWSLTHKMLCWGDWWSMKLFSLMLFCALRGRHAWYYTFCCALARTKQYMCDTGWKNCYNYFPKAVADVRLPLGLPAGGPSMSNDLIKKRDFIFKVCRSKCTTVLKINAAFGLLFSRGSDLVCVS